MLQAMRARMSIWWPVPLLVILAAPACACTAPEPPLLPQSADDIRRYADMIRADFESYIADVQGYFRCLEAERARVFAEAQEVTRDYDRFLSLTR